jgi:hypothetical protein
MLRMMVIVFSQALLFLWEEHRPKSGKSLVYKMGHGEGITTRKWSQDGGNDAQVITHAYAATTGYLITNGGNANYKIPNDAINGATETQKHFQALFCKNGN